MISKREVLLGGALTILIGGTSICSCGAASSGVRSFGCYVAPDEADYYFGRADSGELALPNMDRIRYRSGSPMFDFAMAQTLSHLSGLVAAVPAFAFLDEPGEKNAFATDVAMLKTADGTILFGKKLIADLFKTFGTDRGPAIVSVCAHEFGHIIAYRRGLAQKLQPDRKKPYRSEQFADYFAGWYAGVRKKNEEDFQASVFANTLGYLTGKERGTHGTATDRMQAVVEGYKASFERHLPLNNALEEGARYALAQPE